MIALRGIIAGALAGLALSAAVPASAATLFTLTGSDSATTGANGNTYVTTVGGITVTATAWSTAGYGLPVTTDTPQSAHLGAYSLGLGVTDPCQAGDFFCALGFGGDDHTVDNTGRYDFIRLVFSQSVTLDGAVLNAVNDGHGNDTDAWMSYGNSTNTDAAAWTTYLTNGVAVDSQTGSFNSSAFGTVWLIGAAHGPSNDLDDSFKLKSVTVSSSAVPEPAVWVMMLVGFGAIGVGMRRRPAARTGNALLA